MKMPPIILVQLIGGILLTGLSICRVVFLCQKGQRVNVIETAFIINLFSIGLIPIINYLYPYSFSSLIAEIIFVLEYLIFIIFVLLRRAR